MTVFPWMEPHGELMETFNEIIIIVYYPRISGEIAVVVICPAISLCYIVV